MGRTYSSRSKTKRWPVVHFQNLLDVGAMNAHTIYELNHPNWTSIPIQNRKLRKIRNFLNELVIELAKPYIRNRLGNLVDIRVNLR